MNTRIGAIINQNPMISSEAIASKLNQTCEDPNMFISPRTVRARCNQMGYNSKKPIVVPFLTRLHIAKRIEYEKNHREIDWDSVIFSDESTL